MARIHILQFRVVLGLTALLTIAALGVWQATGGNYYTKFEVVEEVETAIDPDDPLATAGFYDGTSQKQTVTRPEFRLGLLPTGMHVLDKHMASVLSFLAPIWILAAGYMWLYRRRWRSPV